MLRGRRGLQASAAPARELGRLVAAGVGLGAVVVIVAALAVGSPDRIVTLVRDNATRMSALDAVSVVRFYGGVGALVALSLGVVAGLLASDRVLLDARRRLWAQSVHRTMGVLTVGFLATHLVTEVAAQRVGPVAAAVPLFTGSPYLSLGPIAGYLITIAMWTGLIRARFAGRGRPGLWRVLHAAGYLAWPVALVHGLRAGRPAADWVVASYLLLLVVVAVVLGLRVSGERRHRRPCVGAPVAGLGAGLRTAGITGAGPAAVGPAAAGPAAEGLSGVGFAAPAQRSGHPDPMRQDPMHPGPMRPVSARPVSGPAARPVVGDRGAVRPVSGPVGDPGPARPVSVPVAGRQAPARQAPARQMAARQAPARTLPEPRRRPGSAPVPVAVDLELRRKPRTGQVGHDEVDERYLAALRGELR